MEVFAGVVESQGFSAAARPLGLSKSAVSKQVGRLEARLGVRTLNRNTRRLSLTEAGPAFYTPRRGVQDEAGAAQRPGRLRTEERRVAEERGSRQREWGTA